MGWRRVVATLEVRNLPDDVHEMLRRRAAAAGVSLTALVAAVLSESPAVPTTDEWLAGRHGRQVRADEDVDVTALLDDVRQDHDPR